MRFVLASASPRRRDLLARLGVPFEVVPSEIAERLPRGRPSDEVAVALARAKARAVAARLGAARGPTAVLGADTVVVLGPRILGKPASRRAARAMLVALRGRSHQVVTGLALVRAPSGEEATVWVRSRVTMRRYSPGVIEAYLDSGEPYDKAGAYAVQGLGGRLVARVEGCYTNVVGLPLRATARLLREAGFAPRLLRAVRAAVAPGPARRARIRRTRAAAARRARGPGAQARAFRP